MENPFSARIQQILRDEFSHQAESVYEASPLIQYIALKTRSAQKGSKSRGSFANLYAIYVLVEDYLANGFDKSGEYSKYSGAQFSRLFSRQRELPFGAKLQNHALNHRLNEEFKKFFPAIQYLPVIRDVETNRYWFNEKLLIVNVGSEKLNLAKAIIEIINAYIDAKKEAFELFIGSMERLIELKEADNEAKIKELIHGLLEPNVDARIFEIISFAILKTHYKDTEIYFGYDPGDLTKDNLHLYKTGRTNANDGGIDFVMKPLGRFFQVTETLDVKKYFLDIDKIERYPVTFVVKSESSSEDIISALRQHAKKHFPVETIVEKYMNSIEEVINIHALKQYAQEAFDKNDMNEVLEEIILQSKVEFNYEENE